MFLLYTEGCAVGEGVVAHCFIERQNMITAYRNTLHVFSSIYHRDHRIMAICLALNPTERLVFQHLLPAFLRS